MQAPMENNKSLKENFTTIITNKRSRSLLFLVITFVLILMVNGLLPVLSGQAHYTADQKTFTYAEYQTIKEENDLFDLTYSSKILVELYKQLYIASHPGLTAEEIMLIEPPANMKVNVYTVFFFQSAWWYVDTTISVLSAIFLFYALFNYFITKEKDERKDHVDGEERMRKYNANALDPDTFEPWMEDVFNRERKIKQHIRNTKYALQKLESKTDFKIRRRFKNYFDKRFDVAVDNLLPAVYIEMSKEERKYLDKKEELLLKLTDDYINEYVIYTNIPNFRAIQPGFVYSGVNIAGVGQDEYTSIKSDSEKIRGSLFSRILLSFAITTAFASVLTILAVNVAEQDPFWIFATVLMKIVPLVLQVYFAINFTNDFMEKQLLVNLKARETIALRYMAWVKRQEAETKGGD